MAVNKQKLISSAQKLIQKGQLDKAIKEYQKILAEDAKDVSIRLKVAALLGRLERKEEAIKEYIIVGEAYTKTGFLSKAIAAYKQALQVDYSRVDLYVKLGELSEKLGLTREAISQYKNVAVIYENEGKTKEAIEIIDKICELDPSNLSSKAKLAGLLYQQGMHDDAISRFKEVAKALKAQNRQVDLVNLYERMIAIVPDAVEETKYLARHFVEKNEPSKALSKLKLLLQKNITDEETLYIMAIAYKQLGKKDKVVPVLKELARIYHGQNNTQKVITTLKEILAIDPNDAQSKQALANLGPAAQAAAPPAAPPPPVPVAAPPPVPAAAAPPPVPAAAPPPPAPAAAAAPPAPRGASAAGGVDDLTKTLNDAEVFLKYGMHQQAVEQYGRVLDIEANHLGAHLKIIECYFHLKNNQMAGEWLLKAADIYEKGGDSTNAEKARAKASSLGVAASAAAPQAAPEATPAAPAAPSEGDAFEFEFQDDGGEDEGPAVVDDGFELDGEGDGDLIDEDENYSTKVSFKHDEAVEDEVIEDDVLEDDFDVEIEDSTQFNISEEDSDLIDDSTEDEEFIVDEDEVEPDLIDDEASAEDSFDLDLSDDIDAEGEETELGEDLDLGDNEPSLEEQLDEAEFYFHQSLYAEAKKIYENILDKFPGEGRATDKLQEIAKFETVDDDSVADSEFDLAPPSEGEGEEDFSLDMDSPDEEESGLADDMAPPEDEEFDLSAELDSPEDEPEISVDIAPPEDEQSSEFDLAAELDGSLSSESEAEAEAEPEIGDDGFDLSAELEESIEADSPEPEPEAEAEEGGFDLSAELSDTMEEEAAAPEESAADEFDLAAELSSDGGLGDLFGDEPAKPAAVAQDLSKTLGLDALFDDDGPTTTGTSDFNQLAGSFKVATADGDSGGDFDSHFNLGIGYKEMGMYDQAAKEFELAKNADITKAVDCIIMIGLCLREKSEPLEAIKVFKQARDIEDITPDGKMSLSYEIALTLEAMGQGEKALKAYKRIVDKDSEYRRGEAVQRYERLKQEVEGAAAEEEEEKKPTPISSKTKSAEDEAEKRATVKKKKRKKVSYV